MSTPDFSPPRRSARRCPASLSADRNVPSARPSQCSLPHSPTRASNSLRTPAGLEPVVLPTAAWPTSCRRCSSVPSSSSPNSFGSFGTPAPACGSTGLCGNRSRHCYRAFSRSNSRYFSSSRASNSAPLTAIFSVGRSGWVHRFLSRSPFTRSLPRASRSSLQQRCVNSRAVPRHLQRRYAYAEKPVVPARPLYVAASPRLSPHCPISLLVLSASAPLRCG